MPDPNELMNINPGMSPPAQPPLPAPLPGSLEDLQGLSPVPAQPGVSPAAAVRAPVAAPPAAPAEDQLQRALRLAATDSSQLTQADYSLLAADELARENAAAAGRGGPTHSIKVGESQSNTTQRTKVGEKAKAADAAVQGTYADRSKAIDDAAANQMAELNAKAALQEQQAAGLAQQNAKEAEAEAARQQRMAKLEVDQNNLAAEVAKEARSVDPDKWLHESKGRTIGAALAAALGAYGATLGKTPNYALQIINDAIDRDFQGQKLRLGARQEQLSMAGKVIDRTRALFSDQRAADLAARSNLLQLNAAQVEALGTRFKGTAVEANAAEAKALIAQEAAKLNAQAMHLEDVHQSSTTQAQMATVDASGQGVGTGSGKGVMPLTPFAIAQRAAELKKKQDEAKFTGDEDSANSQRRTREALDRFAAFNTLLNTSLPALRKAIKDTEIIGAGPITVENNLGQAYQDKKQLRQMVVQDAVKALSGANATDAESAAIGSSIIPDESMSAARQIRGVHTYLGIKAADMRALYDSLTPDGKAQILRAAGGDKARLERMLSGKPVNDWIEMGTEAGGTAHTEK